MTILACVSEEMNVSSLMNNGHDTLETGESIFDLIEMKLYIYNKRGPEKMCDNI